MSHRTQHHQEQEANPQLLPNRDVQGQTPLHEEASAAAAVGRARSAPPSGLRPPDILALQRTVGNQAVQRMVAERTRPGAVQRHVAEGDHTMGHEGFQKIGQGMDDTYQATESLGKTVSALKKAHSSMAAGWDKALSAFVHAENLQCPQPTEGEGQASAGEG